jgi:hypothetical protein
MNDQSFASLDVFDELSSHELAKATFLLMCSLSEHLIGKVPCVSLKGESEIPTLIHGADGIVSWIDAPQLAQGQKPESLSERFRKPISIVPSEPDAEQ